MNIQDAIKTLEAFLNDLHRDSAQAESTIPGYKLVLRSLISEHKMDDLSLTYEEIWRIESDLTQKSERPGGTRNLIDDIESVIATLKGLG